MRDWLRNFIISKSYLVSINLYLFLLLLYFQKALIEIFYLVFLPTKLIEIKLAKFK